MEQESGTDQNESYRPEDRGGESIPDGLTPRCFCFRSGGGCLANDRPIFELLHQIDAAKIISYTQDLKRLDRAYEAAGAAVVENPNCWKMQRALGHVFRGMRKPQFARIHLARAIGLFRVNGLQPNFIKILHTELGQAALQDGDLAEARASFEAALLYPPAHEPAVTGLAEVKSRETLAGDRGFNGHKLLDEGHGHEKAGRYAEACDCYTRAKKELQALGFKYDRPATVRRFNDYKAGCTAAEMLRLNEIARRTWKSFHSPIQPVFILGYPRSGTTLIEQILASSPAVTAGGEFPFLVEIANAAPRLLGSTRPYPFCLNELEIADTEIALQAMRFQYVGRVTERMATRGGFVTDKMPLNEIYLPLLHVLFPYSPKILIHRDWRDVIVSNFALFLTHGSHQADAPEHCADHIRLVDDLIRHYLAKMRGCGLQLFSIDYETLVRTPETLIPKICAFAGLEFSPAMLHPEKVTRYAHTASYSQVREPINEKGIGRWLHFAQQLEAAGIR